MEAQLRTVIAIDVQLKESELQCRLLERSLELVLVQLLSFYHTQARHSRWGIAFFDSREENVGKLPTRKDLTKDFTTNSVMELRELISKNLKQVVASQNAGNRSKGMSQALWNLLGDLDWETLHNSPAHSRSGVVGKGPEQDKELDHKHPLDKAKKHHAVLVFSNCPGTPAEMADFLGSQNEAHPGGDHDVNAVSAREATLRETYANKKIHVLWMDTAALMRSEMFGRAIPDQPVSGKGAKHRAKALDNSDSGIRRQVAGFYGATVLPVEVLLAARHCLPFASLFTGLLEGSELLVEPGETEQALPTHSKTGRASPRRAEPWTGRLTVQLSPVAEDEHSNTDKSGSTTERIADGGPGQGETGACQGSTLVLRGIVEAPIQMRKFQQDGAFWCRAVHGDGNLETVLQGLLVSGHALSVLVCDEAGQRPGILHAVTRALGGLHLLDDSAAAAEEQQPAPRRRRPPSVSLAALTQHRFGMPSVELGAVAASTAMRSLAAALVAPHAAPAPRLSAAATATAARREELAALFGEQLRGTEPPGGAGGAGEAASAAAEAQERMPPAEEAAAEAAEQGVGESLRASYDKIRRSTHGDDLPALRKDVDEIVNALQGRGWEEGAALAHVTQELSQLLEKPKVLADRYKSAAAERGSLKVEQEAVVCERNENKLQVYLRLLLAELRQRAARGGAGRKANGGGDELPGAQLKAVTMLLTKVFLLDSAIGKTDLVAIGSGVDRREAFIKEVLCKAFGGALPLTLQSIATDFGLDLFSADPPEPDVAPSTDPPPSSPHVPPTEPSLHPSARPVAQPLSRSGTPLTRRAPSVGRSHLSGALAGSHSAAAPTLASRSSTPAEQPLSTAAPGVTTARNTVRGSKQVITRTVPAARARDTPLPPGRYTSKTLRQKTLPKPDKRLQRPTSSLLPAVPADKPAAPRPNPHPASGAPLREAAPPSSQPLPPSAGAPPPPPPPRAAGPVPPHPPSPPAHRPAASGVADSEDRSLPMEAWELSPPRSPDAPALPDALADNTPARAQKARVLVPETPSSAPRPPPRGAARRDGPPPVPTGLFAANLAAAAVAPAATGGGDLDANLFASSDGEAEGAGLEDDEIAARLDEECAVEEQPSGDAEAEEESVAARSAAKRARKQSYGGRNALKSAQSARTMAAGATTPTTRPTRHAKSPKAPPKSCRTPTKSPATAAVEPAESPSSQSPDQSPVTRAAARISTPVATRSRPRDRPGSSKKGSESSPAATPRTAKRSRTADALAAVCTPVTRHGKRPRTRAALVS